MNRTDKIYVAGHRGFVGAAICRRLRALGFTRIVTRTRAELDLRDPHAVASFLREESPAVVIDAAATVGGIEANRTWPVRFIHDNLLIQCNLIDAAYRSGAKKFVFLGSSCIYPRLAPQPLKEDYLLTGPLEPSNEPYAVAKIAGIKTCEAYRREFGFDAISLMPTNLYGPGDNFDLRTSHVLPALIRKFHEAACRGAPSVTVWGTGTPRREFLYVDDFADAAVFLAQHYDDAAPINVGTGRDIPIAELAATVGRITGFSGTITYDASKPDGTPRKLLDISRLTAAGWCAHTGLEEGIEKTWLWFRAHHDAASDTAAGAHRDESFP